MERQKYSKLKTDADA